MRIFLFFDETAHFFFRTSLQNVFFYYGLYMKKSGKLLSCYFAVAIPRFRGHHEIEPFPDPVPIELEEEHLPSIPQNAEEAGQWYGL